MLHSVTHLLTDNPYVYLTGVDVNKAFDTVGVRHSTLLDKMTRLDMPDEVL